MTKATEAATAGLIVEVAAGAYEVLFNPAAVLAATRCSVRATIEVCRMWGRRIAPPGFAIPEKRGALLGGGK